MRRFVLALLLVAGCATARSGDSSESNANPTTRPSSWGAGLGDHHHPVSTHNPDAQRAFNEGLTLVYAFNHDEAIRSFQRAAELDPNLAMAYWGIGLALGPNYNIDVTPEAEKKAYEAVQKAIALSRNAPQQEKDYIKALSVRYSNDPNPDLKALSRAYADAMKQLSQKYPDDLDAATLYADSLMLLRPWQLWTKDGKPQPGTEEIVTVLESVMARNPDHPGANHLYIHAIEASNHPGRALEAAGRLPGLAPAAGHLVHMPSHIYQRVGDYEAAGNSNVAAIEADEDYFRVWRPPAGPYSMMYYPHNIHFLSIARCMEGRSTDAQQAAQKLVKVVEPHVSHMPMLEGFMPVPEMVMVRFGQWDEILKSPEPSGSMPTTHALWRFSRGMALLAKDNPALAKQEYDQFVAEYKAIPKDAPFSMLNDAHSVLAIADDVFAAKLALNRNDTSKAIALLEAAAKKEDALNYTEPPDWILPCREMIGGILLRAGQPAEAEKVFREDLKYNPRSGRSLFGLSESLKAQGKTWDATLVEEQFDVAWKKADVKLTINDL